MKVQSRHNEALKWSHGGGDRADWINSQEAMTESAWMGGGMQHKRWEVTRAPSSWVLVCLGRSSERRRSREGRAGLGRGKKAFFVDEKSKSCPQ